MLATANGHDMIVDLFTNKYEADIDIMSFVRGLFIVLYTLFAGLRYFVTKMFVVTLFVFCFYIYLFITEPKQCITLWSSQWSSPSMQNIDRCRN